MKLEFGLNFRGNEQKIIKQKLNIANSKVGNHLSSDYFLHKAVENNRSKRFNKEDVLTFLKRYLIVERPSTESGGKV